MRAKNLILDGSLSESRLRVEQVRPENLTRAIYRFARLMRRRFERERYSSPRKHRLRSEEPEYRGILSGESSHERDSTRRAPNPSPRVIPIRRSWSKSRWIGASLASGDGSMGRSVSLAAARERDTLLTRAPEGTGDAACRRGEPSASCATRCGLARGVAELTVAWRAALLAVGHGRGHHTAAPLATCAPPNEPRYERPARAERKREWERVSEGGGERRHASELHPDRGSFRGAR